jgi:integrase
MPPRPIDRSEILDLDEVQRVVGDLRRRALLKKHGAAVIEPGRNLAVFRLSACAGLRASELVGLNLGDVHTGIGRPYIFVRGAISKRGQSRRVPLSWDKETAADLHVWKLRRASMGAGPADPFLCRTRGDSLGVRMGRQDAWSAWRVAVRVLGPDRVRSTTLHTGRHTFASWALTAHPLRRVQSALGHRSIATTDRYAHVIAAGDGDGALFMPDGERSQLRPDRNDQDGPAAPAPVSGSTPPTH